jgi:hypothetical protein
MANTFKFTAAQAAGVAARLVSEDAFLSALISRNGLDALGSKPGVARTKGQGRTVDIPVPTALIAHDRDLDDKTTALIKDEITETTIAVTLGAKAYNNVWLSDEDKDLDLASFSDQVLAPQAAAVVDRIEREVADALNAITLDTTIAWDEAAPEKTFTQIRKALRLRGVPQTGLQVVVGVNVYAALLDAKAITDASESGSTAALRDGNVGRVRGFNVVESTRVDDDEIVAFHRDAFTLVTRPNTVPAEASFGATINHQGFSLRHIREYDSQHTASYSLVDTLFGVASLPLFRITRDYAANSGAGAATVSQVTGGAAFRMSIADTEPA